MAHQIRTLLRSMQGIASVLATVIGMAAAPAASAPPSAPIAGKHEFAFEKDGLPRRYVVHVPKSYDGHMPVPVVIMYHGGGGKAAVAMRETRLPEKSEQAGFLAVFPEGNPPDPTKRASFQGNPQTWNDGSGRFHAGKANIDDVGFTETMLDDLSKNYRVDPRRIYVTGFSNGSSMAYRLGAELSHRIAAIAPIASSGLKIEDFKLSRPVPLLSIQGVSDPRNPLAGGVVNIFGTPQKRPPPRKSIERWAAACGCPAEAQAFRDEGGVKAIRYTPCRDNAEVIFYTVSGLGHQWAGGEPSALPDEQVGPYTDKINATDIIWEFFQRHQLPDTVQRPSPTPSAISQ